MTIHTDIGYTPWNPPMEQAMGLDRRVFFFRRVYVDEFSMKSMTRPIEYTICLN